MTALSVMPGYMKGSLSYKDPDRAIMKSKWHLMMNTRRSIQQIIPIRTLSISMLGFQIPVASPTGFRCLWRDVGHVEW